MEERMQALYRYKAAGEFRAVQKVALAMLTSPGDLAPADLFEAARAGATAAMNLRDVFAAAKFSEAEVSHAEAARDSELLGVALYHHATATMYLGDTTVCLEQLDRFIALDSASRLSWDRYRGAVWFNKGLVHQQRREYRAAVDALLHARGIAEAAGDVRLQVQADLEAAWVELLDGRHEPAGFYLERASILLTDDHDEALQATLLCHRAYYHFRLREYVRAADLVQEVLTPGRVGVTAHHRSEAAWIGGEVGLALGQLHEARQLMQVAMDEALTAKWPTLMNRACDLRRRIHEADDQSA